jgi:hypothetical protein
MILSLVANDRVTFQENDYNNDIHFYFILLHFLTHKIRVRVMKTENKYSY